MKNLNNVRKNQNVKKDMTVTSTGKTPDIKRTKDLLQIKGKNS